MEEEKGPEVMSNRELQQSLVYIEQLKEQINTLSEQFEILELAMREHTQAIDTIKNFDQIGKDNELLVPIGADTLVFGKIIDNSKVIINIGAGIAMEETIENALAKLGERVEKIETNKNKVSSTIQNLQEQVIMLSQQVEENYRKLQ